MSQAITKRSGGLPEMNEFAGMEELLQDFLQESSDLLSDVDSKLLSLEQSPNDGNLLNDIFRGIHTIKGGAGFLNAHELVSLCHLTENLFDRLRNAELQLNANIMDAILAATSEIRHMFGALAQGVQPAAAPPNLIAFLRAAVSTTAAVLTVPAAGPEIDEARLRTSVYGRRATDVPGSSAPLAGRREAEGTRENSIRVDTELLDQLQNLSREIGLTRNRLNQLRTEVLLGTTDPGTLRALDEAVNQLDMLVVSLQNSVMKTRMQPIGRLFKKFPRLVRGLARQLGKEVELVLSGEEAEIDKTMIEDLNDPLVHLIRNAVDHGIEDPEQRQDAGKPSKGLIQLQAHQIGHHMIIVIADDGRGMHPDTIRAKAVKKGLIRADIAKNLDETQCLELIFIPGFSTKDQISSVSGRGVGMDVVKTNIQKLKGTVSIRSTAGKGTELTLSLPLSLATMPVLPASPGRTLLDSPVVQ